MTAEAQLRNKTKPFTAGRNYQAFKGSLCALDSDKDTKEVKSLIFETHISSSLISWHLTKQFTASCKSQSCLKPTSIKQHSTGVERLVFWAAGPAVQQRS
jgi:hypothetical protein